MNWVINSLDNEKLRDTRIYKIQSWFCIAFPSKMIHKWWMFYSYVSLQADVFIRCRFVMVRHWSVDHNKSPSASSTFEQETTDLGSRELPIHLLHAFNCASGAPAE